MDANYRRRWSNDLRAFQGRHPSGSKYESESYRFRSKLYRPKARQAIRKTEAAGASAFFSSLDAVSVEPTNEKDDLSTLVAKAKRETLQYYLQKGEMKWFQTVIGALQDSQKIGCCISYNYWKYKVRWKKTTDEAGNATYESITTEDRPCVELWPMEYVRFHPAANWMDPFKDSPYLIRMIPMHVLDVKARAKKADRYEIPFTEVTDNELNAAKVSEDLTAITRHEGRQQPDVHGETPGITDYDLVWVHENIFRDEDQNDVIFYTLGSNNRISEVVPLEDAYWTGERPMTIGFFIMETHIAVPPSVPHLAKGVQKEINDLANVRLDNLHLVTNKRYLVQRGTQVDIKSLTRNAPASVTMVNDVDKDVRELEFNDINPGAFAEQDRLNVDHDELVGNFSQSSVQTNRQMNETVGGMNMMMSGAGQMTDYGLRCFSESWLEPTLRQVDNLIAAYESSPKVLTMVAKKLEIQAQPEDILSLLQMEAQITIDVGVGASNPMFKLERFLMGLERYIKASVDAGQRPHLDHKEFASELWGLVGYKNPRFLDLPKTAEEEQAMGQLEQQIAELTQQVEQDYGKEQAKQQAEMQKIEMKEKSGMTRDQMQIDADLDKIKAEALVEAEVCERTMQCEIAKEESKAKIQASIDNMNGMREDRMKRLEIGAKRLSDKDAADNTRKEKDRDRRAQRDLEAKKQRGAKRMEKTKQQGAQDLETSKQTGAMTQSLSDKVSEARKTTGENDEAIAKKLLADLKKAQETENKQREELVSVAKELLDRPARTGKTH